MSTTGERNRVFAHTGAGVAGGMFGLALVGLAEALTVLWQAGSLTDLGVVPFALIVYGVCGALAGGGLGFTVGLVARPRPGAFALYVATLFFGGAAVIGRFRVIRDVFNEQMPQGLVPRLVEIAVLVFLAFVAVGIFRLARRLGETSFGQRLTRPLGATVALGVVAAISAAAAAIPGALEEEEPPPSRVAREGAPPIILIMVDTLRADHLSCYGYEGIRTPHLDRLAADGIRFARAFAQSSWTRPSVATILTSLYPSSHGAVHKGDALGDSVETVAEVLQAHGYHTIGLANNANVSEAFNFQQGFDTYTYLAPELFFHASESATELTVYRQLRVMRERFLTSRKWVRNYYQPAEVVTDRALDIVAREKESPFFLFLHYMDPHDPYFAHPFDGEGVARVAEPNPDPSRAQELRQLYDGEIVYLDEHLGRLFDGLRALGIYERAMILVTSDHGEEFFEHGGWWHGTTLYEEQIGVVLIVKAPAHVGGGRVVTEMARSLDIAPTLLAAAGAPIPEEMQGRVLTFISPDDGSPGSIFAEEAFEGNFLRAARTPHWKLILANPDNPRGQPALQLFDLGVDPNEQDNLFGKGREEEPKLEEELRRLYTEARRYTRDSEQRAVDGATADQLKALGYVD